MTMESRNGLLRYAGDGFDLDLDLADPAGSASGHADGPVDLTWLRIMDQILKGVTAAGATNFVNAALTCAADR
jgi:putative selenate reductase